MSRDLVADVKRQQTQRGFSYDLDAQPFGCVNKAILILIHLTSHRVHSVKQTSLTTISSRLTPWRIRQSFLQTDPDEATNFNYQILPTKLP